MLKSLTMEISRIYRPLFLSALVALAGCHATPPPALIEEITVLQPAAAARLLDAGEARTQLYAQYREWRDVRYRNGGLSKKGIDCSGFVYLTFRDRFGIALPRSTDEQSTLGRKIEDTDLRPGDLVFFRTGRNVRHVGIYLEDRKFLHASTIKGVTISSLDDIYWSKEYWRAISFKT